MDTLGRKELIENLSKDKDVPLDKVEYIVDQTLAFYLGLAEKSVDVMFSRIKKIVEGKVTAVYADAPEKYKSGNNIIENGKATAFTKGEVEPYKPVPEKKYVKVKSNLPDDPEDETEEIIPNTGHLDVPPCPTCGKVMVKRKGKRGTFWGCSGYPACKGVLAK